jgi:hypothetical protein
MSTERNARDGEPLLDVPLEERSAASPEAVYDLLADLDSHLEWGGRRQKKGYRLETLDAPAGPATVGTEFRTTGIAPDGAFDDASVVTEARRPSVFEFVTTATQRPKRGEPIVWTTVSRYELEPQGAGSTIRYSMRVMQMSRKPWWQNSVGRALVRFFGGRNSRVGLRNLARMAEERASVDRAA